MAAENKRTLRLLASADARTVQEVGGGAKGITLDPDDVDLGDTVFVEDTDEGNVKKLYLPGADE